MTQLFNASDYATIHSLVFRDDYPGYKPNVVESPNGDGKLDSMKRYAHVAEKYLSHKNTGSLSDYCKSLSDGRGAYNDDMDLLSKYLDRAHLLSLEVAVSIGVPREFWPVRKYGALRVLEYGSNATSAEHTDFDLFTLMCYRNLPEYFTYCLPPKDSKRSAWLKGLTRQDTAVHRDSARRAQHLNSQVHFGELLEEIDSRTFRADDHKVIASGGPSQYSIVYFCVPDEEAVLPSGLTVGQWMAERKGRSRYDRS